MNQEYISIIAAVFHKNGLVLQLEKDREDFWMNLGPCWGFFQNRNRLLNLPTVDQPDFLLTCIRLQDEEPPHPVLSSSNVLWRLQEGYEVSLKVRAFFQGFQFPEERTFPKN